MVTNVFIKECQPPAAPPVTRGCLGTAGADSVPLTLYQNHVYNFWDRYFPQYPRTQQGVDLLSKALENENFGVVEGVAEGNAERHLLERTLSNLKRVVELPRNLSSDQKNLTYYKDGVSGGTKSYQDDFSELKDGFEWVLARKKLWIPLTESILNDPSLSGDIATRLAQLYQEKGQKPSLEVFQPQQTLGLSSFRVEDGVLDLHFNGYLVTNELDAKKYVDFFDRETNLATSLSKLLPTTTEIKKINEDDTVTIYRTNFPLVQSTADGATKMVSTETRKMSWTLSTSNSVRCIYIRQALLSNGFQVLIAYDSEINTTTKSEKVPTWYVTLLNK